jgi:hypothetical protein
MSGRRSSSSSSSSSFPMTEWTLQKRLTGIWARQGVTVGEERLYLAAWEVMTDWRINDAARHWARPSIDFVCLDSVGRLVLIELKLALGTPRQAWSALCQVTHRAVALGRSYTPEALGAAHRACWSGVHGRVSDHEVESVWTDHARFFGFEAPDQLVGRPVRRVVAAATFGAAWDGVLTQFRTKGHAEVGEQLRRRYRTEAPANRELARFLALDGAEPEVMDPVGCFLVDESWPGSRIRCPACGLRGGVELAYGFPGPGMFEAAERGEIMLGGCVVGADEPVVWGCVLCRHEWGPVAF